MIRLYSSIKLLLVVKLKIPEKSQLGSDFFFKFLRFLVYCVGFFFLKDMLAIGGFILKH